MRQLLIEKVGVANTTIRLGPEVLLDFSDVTRDGSPLLSMGPCVTLTSVASFDPPGELPALQARSPRSEGPLLRSGASRTGFSTFIEIRCFADESGNDSVTNDGVTISGFRIHGPSFEGQTTEENAIRINSPGRT